ncbi:MAG: hypothetical protein ACRD23_19580 [Terriglobales bacterium]
MREVAELLVRPEGRPSQEPLIEYKIFLHRAASWTTARQVVAKMVVKTGGRLVKPARYYSDGCWPRPTSRGGRSRAWFVESRCYR